MTKDLNIKETEQEIKKINKTMQEEWKEYIDFLNNCKKVRNE